MALEVVEFDDAYREHRQALIALHYSAWGGLDDLAAALRARRAGYPFAPYLGLYLRDGDSLLSAVMVSHYPFTTPDGEESVAGIELLMTRPDALRGGLAGRLLEEVHRRERDAGRRLSLLCTGRSNLAHELYLKLGYQDIFSPRSTIRRVDRPTPRAPSGVRVRRARPSDAPGLARIHRRASAGAVGFVRRDPRSYRVRFLSGAGAIRRLLVAERGGRMAGYALLEPHSGWSRSAEVIAPNAEARAALLNAVERGTPGGWLVLGSDWFPAPIAPDPTQYTGFLPSYAVMMACPIAPELRRRKILRWLRSGGRAFACRTLDMF